MADSYYSKYTGAQIDSAVQKVLAGGVLSWNDLSDKPFYEDEDGTIHTLDDKYLACVEVTEASETDVFAETTLENFHLDAEFGYVQEIGFDETVPAFNLSMGDSCTIVWDGEIYNCTVWDGSALISGALGLGNGSSIDQIGNNEPFAIGWTSTGALFLAVDGSTETSHTVRIYQTNDASAKIKEEYLPEIIPAATAEDNGKFLMIADGAPAWVSLTDVSQEGA